MLLNLILCVGVVLFNRNWKLKKNMVFQEVFPQALTLTADVFGNYVIQKI